MTTKEKLYVGSLPYKTTEEELYQIFSQFGPIVSVKIVTDRVTGQSKGFGFVEMENSDDAKKAIEAVNNTELGGRTLVVSIARPPQAREEGGGGGGWQKQRPRRERY